MLAPGGEAYDAVVREFGREILTSDGRIDRTRLATLVFGSPERLARLNALVHPPVVRREEELIAEFAAREPRRHRRGGGGHPDRNRQLQALRPHRSWCACAEEQQVERALRRDGAVEADVRARLSRQMPLEEKRKFADFVIDTSGQKEDTLRQTRAVYEALRRIET